MKKSRAAIGGIAIVLVIAATMFFLERPASVKRGEAFKIGALLPLTGDAASYGEDCRQGIELAVENARKRQPRKIEIIFEDSKADPKTAISAFNKLVSVDRSQAVIGDMFSSSTLAIAPLAQQAKVLLLSPTAADERIPATGDYIFSIYPSASDEGKFMAMRLDKAVLDRVAILYQNQTATKAIADAFANMVRQRGGTVSVTESIPEEKSSYRSLLDKVASHNPTAVYISAYRDPVALLITMGREMGIKTLYATQSTLYDEKALVDYAGKLDGVLISGPFFDSSNEAQAVIAFSSEYKTRFGHSPSVWSAYGYDAADLLLDSFLEAAKDGTNPKDKLVGRVFSGLTGRTEIKPDRSVDKQMVLYRVQANKFVKE
jgi:branched-chain amino acid transport system substrate-binding protein